MFSLGLFFAYMIAILVSLFATTFLFMGVLGKQKFKGGALCLMQISFVVVFLTNLYVCYVVISNIFF